MDVARGAPRSPGFVIRAGLWGLVACATLAVLVTRRFHPTRTEALPVLWQLPAWELTDQDGHAFGARELRDRVYVANFVFTSCVLECPRLTRQMSHLQEHVRELNGRSRLVSISVDPINDTPERL